jgi:tryptophanase
MSQTCDRCGPAVTTEQPFRTIIEPFRIHSVEPMRLPARAERARALEAAGYNLWTAVRASP